MKKTNIKGKAQAGFTFIELLIVVTILGILAAVGLSVFNPNKTKAVALNDNLGLYHTAMARLNMDTGCYPEDLTSMFDKTKAVASANAGFCAADVDTAISDPYIEPVTVDANGDINLPKIGANAVVTNGYFTDVALGEVWYFNVAGLEADLLQIAVNECNGTPQDAAAPTAWSATVKCIDDTGVLKYAYNRKS